VIPELLLPSRGSSLPLLGERFKAAAETLALPGAPKAKHSDLYREFQRRYRHDFSGFARDCIQWREGEDGLTTYQNSILDGLMEHQRASARGPHGLGKTALAALCVLAFSLTRDGEDWKVVTTASAWRQLSAFLWPEIHKWARRIRWEVVGREPLRPRDELLDMALKLGTGKAFAVASDNPALIEGAHADQLFYLFDEAKAIPPDTWDAAEGAFSGGGSDTGREAYALAISTPGEPQGRFYEIQARKPGYSDWWVRRVTLDEAIEAGRVSREWVDARRLQWGEGSAVFQNRVLGDFASSDEEGIIPLAWVEAANERWHRWVAAGRPGKLLTLGADIAGEGADKTCLAPLYEWEWDEEAAPQPDADPNEPAPPPVKHVWRVVGDLRYSAREDTMVAAGRVKGVLDVNAEARAVVDVIGLGAGVVHRLREQGCRVEAFNASEASHAKDRSGELGFINRRSEGWWSLREQLDPVYGSTLALPPDDVLTGDLTAPHYRVVSGGRIQVDIKRRLGRSTDAGDAVMQACAPTTRRQVNVY
jgi:hypothetical protein